MVPEHLGRPCWGGPTPREQGGDIYTPTPQRDSLSRVYSPPPSRGAIGPLGLRPKEKLGLGPTPHGMDSSATEHLPQAPWPPKGGEYGREKARRG